MRVAVLATGGKDSALALYHVLKAGHRVKCLATMIPAREDSWMFHYPNIGLVDLFAEAVEIPVMKAKTSGIKEEELGDLKKLIETLDVEGLVSGAIASSYQKTRIEEICRQLGLGCITPLWNKNPSEILEEILNLKFEAIITGVFAYGFSREWLGRRIDDEAVAELMKLNRQFGVSPVGEGGEYETLVLDAPFFKRRVRIIEARKVWKDQSGYYQVVQSAFEDK